MANSMDAEDIANAVWDHQNELGEGVDLILGVFDRLSKSAPDTTIDNFRLGLSMFIDRKQAAYDLADALATVEMSDTMQ